MRLLSSDGSKPKSKLPRLCPGGSPDSRRDVLMRRSLAPGELGLEQRVQEAVSQMLLLHRLLQELPSRPAAC